MPFLLRDVPCFQGRFPCRESGRRVLHLVGEGLGPELRELIPIRRVEYNLSLRSQLNPRSEEDGMLFRQTAADRRAPYQPKSPRPPCVASGPFAGTSHSTIP